MFDYVRELPNDRNNVIVGRILDGHYYSLYVVNVDWTCNGRDWCRSHGMKLVDRVINVNKTAWYEIWASDDLHLMTAFLI